MRQTEKGEHKSRIAHYLGKYPLLTIGLGLGGVVAYGLVGYLGYPDDRDPFGHPWPLYVWFGLLVLAFQWFSYYLDSHDLTLLKKTRPDRLLKQRLRVMLFTFAAFLVVGVFSFFTSVLEQFFSIFANRDAVVATLTNGLLIAIFFVDAVRRWVTDDIQEDKFSQTRDDAGHNSSMHADTSSARRAPSAPISGESLAESQKMDKRIRRLSLISGDLFASASIAFLLTVVMRTSTLGFILMRFNVHVYNCTFALPGSTCPTPSYRLQSLSTLDAVMAISFLILGLAFLFVSALLYAPHHELKFGSALVETIKNTFNLGRQLQAFRLPVWSTLIVAAMIALAWASDYNQKYLHGMQHVWIEFPWARVESPVHAQFLLPILIGGLLATLSLSLAVGVFFEWRVRDVGLPRFRAIGPVSVFFIEIYWIGALILSLVNLLAVVEPDFYQLARAPFPLLSVTFGISAVAFIVLNGPWTKRQSRSSRGIAGSREKVLSGKVRER